MTTINNYSVSLALDAGDYIRESSLSRKETASLKREINSARTPADNYERSISRIEKALKAGAIDQRTYNRLLDSAKGKLTRASMAGNSYATAISGMSTRIVGAVAGLVTFNAAWEQLKAGVRDNAAFEQTAIQFEVLTGNIQDAGNVLAELKAFAASTPFQLPQINKAGSQLLAFKFSADEVVPAVKMLGDISAGTGKNLTELAAIVGKARVEQVIYNDTINQLSEAGINVIDGLAAQFGNVKKAASEGKIQFDDLYAVLKSLTAEGGQFYELTEKKGKAASGQWSTLIDQLREYRKLLAGALVDTSKIGGGQSWLEKLTAGTNILLTNGRSLQDTISAGEAANAAEDLFRRQQLANRRKEEAGGLLSGSLTGKNINLGTVGSAIGKEVGLFFGGTGSALFGGFTGAADQLKEAAMFQFGVYQNQLAIQNKQAAEARNKPPGLDMEKLAPAAMKGSQEAYKIIAQARNSSEQKALQQDAERNRQLAQQLNAQQQMVNALQQLIPQGLM